MKSMILVALAVLSLGVGVALHTHRASRSAPTRAFTARSRKTKPTVKPDGGF